jgi:hypothetical protein
VLEEGVLLPVQELASLRDQRRDPEGAAMEAKRELDERVQVAAACDRADGGQPHAAVTL